MSSQRGLQQIEQRDDSTRQKKSRADKGSGLVSSVLRNGISEQVDSENQRDRAPGEDERSERPQRASPPQQGVVAAAMGVVT
jgi:hypothetical protein